MCIAIPARVVSLGEAIAGSTPGTVDLLGVEREVDLVMVPQAGVGDWVIVHSGYAIGLVPEDRALETIGMLEGSALNQHSTSPRVDDEAPVITDHRSE